jgi:hypothetical protein
MMFSSRLRSENRAHEAKHVFGRAVLATAVNFFWTAGSALAVTAPILVLNWVGMMRRDSPAEAPAAEEPPGSGIVLRTEITWIWVPQALCDLARQRADPLVALSPQELQTQLARKGWRDGWYAFSYRGHQINGRYGDITQIRLLIEAADHLEELQSEPTHLPSIASCLLSRNTRRIRRSIARPMPAAVAPAGAPRDHPSLQTASCARAGCVKRNRQSRRVSRSDRVTLSPKIDGFLWDFWPRVLFFRDFLSGSPSATVGARKGRARGTQEVRSSVPEVAQ